jgi:hypothetical protein
LESRQGEVHRSAPCSRVRGWPSGVRLAGVLGQRQRVGARLVLPGSHSGWLICVCHSPQVDVDASYGGDRARPGTGSATRWWYLLRTQTVPPSSNQSPERVPAHRGQPAPTALTASRVSATRPAQPAPRPRLGGCRAFSKWWVSRPPHVSTFPAQPRSTAPNQAPFAIARSRRSVPPAHLG